MDPRDQFAMAAMAVYLRAVCEAGEQIELSVLAHNSYQVADAMERERMGLNEQPKVEKG